MTGPLDDICDQILRVLARMLVALAEWLGFDLAITEEVPESIVIICGCQQRNRVRHADFNRRPVCGKCKQALRLPS